VRAKKKREGKEASEGRFVPRMIENETHHPKNSWGAEELRRASEGSYRAASSMHRAKSWYGREPITRRHLGEGRMTRGPGGKEPGNKV